ncbi:C25 family cysteine peptidase [Nostoc sp. FACHB-145]|uniref:C25 family cysteine peptidase n=1 Tax=Nostoc sp. FACHB-145 TaxID=2692836 RepID=UPI001687B94A|nr:C25 family cysteine peptidase [Nostoc sp. FACHB-145]MBD2466317.1 bZIP transcription factor [Nostoc sp. FACHB-145]
MADSFENGINGATGDYLFPQPSAKAISVIAKNASISIEKHHLNDLEDRAKQLRHQSKAPAAWVDPTDLANAGWGVIFAETYGGYTLEALKSEDGLGLLLNHRKQQASQQVETYYRECVYKSGQSKNDFLKAYKVPTSGAVDPDRGMPYYLMIVGDPETIPYEFQYQLDVQYAVGRIYFDTLDEYAYYAQSVVRAETRQVERPRQVSFWGVRNRADEATKLSSEKLIKPLSEWLPQKASGWECSTLLAEEATKENLSRQINQGSAPAILFTASHGMGFPKGDSHQKEFQGSLVCQEWTRFSKFDPETQVFSAADIKAEADFHGLIAFHFACYGLGTPQFNDFKQRDGEKELAEAPFIARLPQRLLSHPKGGALAVIGHVDRAFANSFQVSGIKQLTVFQSVLKCLIDQRPVGYAMEFFNQQYAELASDCNLGIRNDNLKDKAIADFWTGSTNARNYAVFGDPAVRIAVSPASNNETSSTNSKVWFNRSNKPPEVNIQQLKDKIKKLEQQVEALQAENQQLREQLAKS